MTIAKTFENLSRDLAFTSVTEEWPPVVYGAKLRELKEEFRQALLTDYEGPVSLALRKEAFYLGAQKFGFAEQEAHYRAILRLIEGGASEALARA